MGRGRKPKWESEEERLQAIKDSKMKYYKKNRVEILEKRKENKKDVPVNKPKPTVYDEPIEEIEEEVWIEPIEDDSASHYTGPII